MAIVQGFTAALLASGAFSAVAETAVPSARSTFNFNPDWRLFVGDPAETAQPEFDDSAWKPVTLPRARNEDAAFKVSIAQHPTGIAWYRKRFKLPADAAGKKLSWNSKACGRVGSST